MIKDTMTNGNIYQSEIRNDRIIKIENAEEYVLKTSDLEKLKEKIEELMNNEWNKHDGYDRVYNRNRYNNTHKHARNLIPYIHNRPKPIPYDKR